MSKSAITFTCPKCGNDSFQETSSGHLYRCIQCDTPYLPWSMTESIPGASACITMSTKNKLGVNIIGYEEKDT